MSQGKKFQKIDKAKLPLFYRLILKLPIPTISTSISIPSGIFWAIIFPVFLILDFYLNIYLLLSYSFPINIILVCVFPVAILMVFIRVTITRFINWWNSSMVGGYVQREVEQVLEEYLVARKNKGREETTNG
jgi:hypothetical protein